MECCQSFGRQASRTLCTGRRLITRARFFPAHQGTTVGRYTWGVVRASLHVGRPGPPCTGHRLPDQPRRFDPRPLQGITVRRCMGCCPSLAASGVPDLVHPPPPDQPSARLIPGPPGHH